MTPGSINRVGLSSSLYSLLNAVAAAQRPYNRNQVSSITFSPDSDNQSLSSHAVSLQDVSPAKTATKSDTVEISSQARKLSKQSANSPQSSSKSDESAAVSKLKAVDREVRAHERAHLAAAGGLARGGASFRTVKGPDGHLYAVAGEVQIDTSPVPGDPDATIRKAETIRRAALAPARPSGQDLAVAAAAGAMEAEARAEKARNKDDSGTNKTESSSQISPDNIRKVSEASETEPGNNQGAGGNDSEQNDLIAKLQKQLDPTEALGKILNLIA